MTSGSNEKYISNTTIRWYLLPLASPNRYLPRCIEGNLCFITQSGNVLRNVPGNHASFGFGWDSLKFNEFSESHFGKPQLCDFSFY